MPNLGTYYKILEILEQTSKGSLTTTDFVKHGINFNSAKDVLSILLKENRVRHKDGRWKLKKKNIQSGCSN